jgi:hypothetical protein
MRDLQKFSVLLYFRKKKIERAGEVGWGFCRVSCDYWARQACIIKGYKVSEVCRTEEGILKIRCSKMLVLSVHQNALCLILEDISWSEYWSMLSPLLDEIEIIYLYDSQYSVALSPQTSFNCKI